MAILRFFIATSLLVSLVSGVTVPSIATADNPHRVVDASAGYDDEAWNCEYQYAACLLQVQAAAVQRGILDDLNEKRGELVSIGSQIAAVKREIISNSFMLSTDRSLPNGQLERLDRETKALNSKEESLVSRQQELQRGFAAGLEEADRMFHVGVIMTDENRREVKRKCREERDLCGKLWGEAVQP